MIAASFCLTTSCDRLGLSGERRAIEFEVKSAATKSAPITTENIKNSPYGKFLSTAFFAGEENAYYEGAQAVYDGKIWKVTEKTWPESASGAPLDFWSYAPVSVFGDVALTYSDAHRTVKFSYSPFSDFEARKDATNQQDIVLAANMKPNPTSLDDGKVPVTFNHALSAVRFKVGNIDSGFADADKIVISQVDLENVKGHGVCTAKYVSETSINFSWVSDQPVAYSQRFDQTFPVTYASAGMYLDTFGADKTVMGSDVFMLIPQQLSGVNITISWSMDGVQHISRTSLVKEGLELKPGIVYTFTIDLKRLVDEKDVFVTLTDILPWEGVSAEIDYSHMVSQSTPLTFDPSTCVIDETSKMVTFKDSETPIRAYFKLTSPVGSTFMVRLQKDFDAFSWDYLGCDGVISDPDDPGVICSFLIRPTVLNPERNYYTNLQISVRTADGRMINCDEILQGMDPSEYYTIVLQKAI